jgi:hypothetical protein
MTILKLKKPKREKVVKLVFTAKQLESEIMKMSEQLKEISDIAREYEEWVGESNEGELCEELVEAGVMDEGGDPPLIGARCLLAMSKMKSEDKILFDMLSGYLIGLDEDAEWDDDDDDYCNPFYGERPKRKRRSEKDLRLINDKIAERIREKIENMSGQLNELSEIVSRCNEVNALEIYGEVASTMIREDSMSFTNNMIAIVMLAEYLADKQNVNSQVT